MAIEPDQPARRESYIHDYDGALTEHVVAGRTADTHAAFFVPHIRPGMAILDCGCGPGTITVGLAQAAFPGTVTGFDLEESQVRAARENAAQLNLSNVQFEQGDAYHLPFKDETFDAVFSHALLEHMRDPMAILKEMRRVLKAGGIIGLRCIDLGGTLFSPAYPALIKAHDLWGRYRLHCGGDAYLGRRLRGLLSEAGFAETVGSASSESWGTPQSANSMVTVLMDEFAGPKISETALREGWMDHAQINEAKDAVMAWGEQPDAFMAIAWCEGVGWKDA